MSGSDASHQSRASLAVSSDSTNPFTIEDGGNTHQRNAEMRMIAEEVPTANATMPASVVQAMYPLHSGRREPASGPSSAAGHPMDTSSGPSSAEVDPQRIAERQIMDSDMSVDAKLDALLNSVRDVRSVDAKTCNHVGTDAS